MSLTRRLVTALAAATAVAALVASPADASAKTHLVRFAYRGVVTTAPGATGTQLGVQVGGGNRPGLRSLIGAAQPTTFTVNSTTQVVLEVGAAPQVGALDALQAGDSVTVVYFAPHGSTLAQIAAQPVKRVWDTSSSTRPRGRLFLYAGKVTAIDTQANTITIAVDFGNWRALYSMLGQPVTETFSYSDATTVVQWSNGAPTVKDENSIAVGSPVTLRAIAPTWLTPIAQVEASSLWRITLGEPRRAQVRDAQADVAAS